MPAPNDLLSESLAHDGRRVFVSSIRYGKISVIEADGSVHDFVKGLGAVLGIKIANSQLWATSVSATQMIGYKKEDDGKSALDVFALKTGKPIAHFEAPGPGPHSLQDLVIAKDGTAYVPDSAQPVLYRLPPGGKALQVFARGPFVSLQGLTFNADESALYLADYGLGVFLLDLQSQALALLPTDTDAVTTGIDGLYFDAAHSALIGTQNGTKPERVVRLALDKNRITGFSVLEAGAPDFDQPSLGEIVGGVFYFVANNQIGHFGDGSPTTLAKLKPTVILQLPLD